jgi:hypothetical protein
MENLHWAFAPTGGGSVDGINNPLITYFAGNFNYHVAREIIQNSLDAKLNENEPVTVKFSIENFNKIDFPGYEEFKDILDECAKFWTKEHSETQSFLSNAKSCLENKIIPVLKCSDFNTVGLDGQDDDLKGSWFSLVKSRGASSKFKGEGGSYGIGKGAPFAASNLHTIFYFTKNKQARPIFQGISELVSFRRNGEVVRGSGSYGENGYSSIRRFEDIPRIFARKADESPGLDVFIMGFIKSKEWKDELVKSVLRNFWYCLLKKELVVEIADTKIDKNSLESLLIKYFEGEKLKDDIEPTGNPLLYYKAVKSGQKVSKTINSIGDADFYFLELPEHMNYVAMMRKPHMVVFSKAYRFQGNYCGVFVCDNKEGNKLLRKMEPPTHNRWEPDLFGSGGQKILNEIHEWIREVLKSKMTLKPKGTLDIPDLYKYLPFDEGSEEGEGVGNIEFVGSESENESSRELQKEIIQEKSPIIKPYTATIINKPIETGVGGELDSPKKHKSKTKGGTGIGDETSERKALSLKQISVASFINKKIPEGFEYFFNIRSDEDRKCSLQIQSISDDDSRDKITILKATDNSGSHIHAAGNKISKIDFYANRENKLTIQIKTITKIALKTEVYELQ